MGALAARRYHPDDDDGLEAIGPVPAHNGRGRPRRAAPAGTVKPTDTARQERAQPTSASKPRTTTTATRGTAALAPTRVADSPSTPPLRVAPPAPVNPPRTPFVFGVVLLVVVGILGLMVLNTKINENSFRLHDLRKQQAGLDAQEQQLKEDLVWRTAPGNLAAAARRLGLVPAGTPAFIRLPDGRVLGVPKPAKAPATDAASPEATTPAPTSGGRTDQRPPAGR